MEILRLWCRCVFQMEQLALGCMLRLLFTNAEALVDSELHNSLMNQALWWILFIGPKRSSPPTTATSQPPSKTHLPLSLKESIWTHDVNGATGCTVSWEQFWAVSFQIGCFSFWDNVSCNPDWLQTCNRGWPWSPDPPASASQSLGWQVCAATTGACTQCWKPDPGLRAR